MKVVGNVTSRDGTSIAYEQTGVGPSIILVDGACCFRGFGPMGPLATQLASRFTVFTYDRRGRGESTDTLPYSVDREVDDLRSLVDVAGGSAFVYGFSSGAVLALRAAADGLSIPKVALLEPPLSVDDTPPSGPDLGGEIAQLMAAGRRGQAVEHFQKSIGVPAEATAHMRLSPSWSTLESIAHTLVYDVTITKSLPVDRLPAITIPTLVLASLSSDDRLLGWARALGDTLPNATLQTLNGEWHGVSAEVLAPVLVDFYLDR